MSQEYRILGEQILRHTDPAKRNAAKDVVARINAIAKEAAADGTIPETISGIQPDITYPVGTDLVLLTKDTQPLTLTSAEEEASDQISKLIRARTKPFAEAIRKMAPPIQTKKVRSPFKP